MPWWGLACSGVRLSNGTLCVFPPIITNTVSLWAAPPPTPACYLCPHTVGTVVTKDPWHMLLPALLSPLYFTTPQFLLHGRQSSFTPAFWLFPIGLLELASASQHTHYRCSVGVKPWPSQPWQEEGLRDLANCLADAVGGPCSPAGRGGRGMIGISTHRQGTEQTP